MMHGCNKRVAQARPRVLITGPVALHRAVRWIAAWPFCAQTCCPASVALKSSATHGACVEGHIQIDRGTDDRQRLGNISAVTLDPVGRAAEKKYKKCVKWI